MIMDYEKKYKEAFKEAEKIHKFSSDIAEIKRMEQIFPELAESEDEKIRKALIDGFTVMKESKNCGKTFSNHNIPVVDILAWLEKQSQVKESPISQHENKTCKENDNSLISENERIKKSIIYGMTALKVQGKETFATIPINDCIAWLEKQSNQDEWTQNDEQYLLICKNALYKYQISDKWDADIIYGWLKRKIKGIKL